MDQSTDKTKPLAGIRTLAKDLASQRTGKPTTDQAAVDAKSTAGDTVAKGTPATPTPTTPVHNVYQPPQWKKNPVQTKQPTVDAPTPELSDALITKTAPTSLISQDSEIVLGNSDNDSATIIRDTKHNRFRLFPAILSSLNQWVEDFKAKQTERRKPKYSVPDSTLRKGVIQKATSKTGKVTSFDASRIQDKVRERNATAMPRRFFTFWTPNTEPGLPLLDAPDDAADSSAVEVAPPIVATPVNVKVEPKRSVYTQIRTSAPTNVTPTVTFNEALPPKETVANIVPVPPVPSVTPPTANLTSRAATITPQPILPTKAPITLPHPPKKISPPIITPMVSKPPVAVPVVTTPLPPVTVIEQKPVTTPAPVISTTLRTDSTPPPVLLNEDTDGEAKPVLTTAVYPTTNWRQRLLSLNTNRLATGVFVMVMVVAVLGGGMYIFLSQNREGVVPLVETPRGLLNSPLQTIELTASNQTPAGISNALKLNVSESGYPLQQIMFTTRSTPTSNPTPLSSGALFDVLNISLNSSFVRSLSSLQFGATNQRPFIAMDGKDYTVLRGGMLAWENTLYQDMRELLNLPETSQAQFRDVLVEGKDARVLRDSSTGSEIMVYGIVDKQVIIVAQNRVDFVTVANNLRQP